MMRTSIFILTLLPFFCFGQQEANNWYFGNGQGLNFSTGSPVQLPPNALQTPEGCASFSDQAGNLLFYTNGGGRNPLTSGQQAGTIWNRNDEVLYDMSFNQGGGFSAIQSSLFLPKPGQDSVYYLFTMEEIEYTTGGDVVGQPQGRGLSYFEIDQRLNGGLGGVTLADQRLFVPTYEGLSATLNEDGLSYWVIAYENNQNINQFISISVDGTGIELSDIQLSFIGFDYPLEGPIKISPDGKWMACGEYIFAFDNRFGTIELPDIFLPNTIAGSFSPDANYYYYWSGSNQLARVDMRATDVAASREILRTIAGNYAPGLMQLAPNGNIYFLRNEAFNRMSILGEIECPQSATPTITTNLFTYMPGDEEFNFLGLPNFADHIFFRESGTSMLTAEPLMLCPGESLVLRPRETGDTYVWSDGSTADTLLATDTGIYRVNIINACGDTVIDEKIVSLGMLPSFDFIGLPADESCLGDTIELRILTDRNESLLWSTGEDTNSISISESGLYAVSVENSCGITTAEVELEFLSTPLVSLDGLPMDSVCIGETVELAIISEGEYSYNWSTGENTNGIAVAEAGDYTVTATNACGSTVLNATIAFKDCPIPVDCDLVVPNIISPNGDGINDKFGGFSNCTPVEFQLRIYSRWGKLVYESTNPNQYWDGQFNDKAAPADVYIYQLQYRFQSNEPLVNKTGDLTVVR